MDGKLRSSALGEKEVGCALVCVCVCSHWNVCAAHLGFKIVLAVVS